MTARLIDLAKERERRRLLEEVALWWTGAAGSDEEALARLIAWPALKIGDRNFVGGIIKRRALTAYERWELGHICRKIAADAEAIRQQLGRRR